MNQIAIDIVVNYVLMPVLVTIVTAAVSWAAVQYNKWTGQQIEAKDREALQSALLNGIRLGLQAVLRQHPSADPARLTVEQQAIATTVAAGYVQRSVPDAVKRFGLSPTRIRDLAEPKLPLPIDPLVAVGRAE